MRIFLHKLFQDLQVTAGDSGRTSSAFFLSGMAWGGRSLALARSRYMEERWPPRRSAITIANTPSSHQDIILALSSLEIFLTCLLGQRNPSPKKLQTVFLG
jgi:hypothetical protein